MASLLCFIIGLMDNLDPNIPVDLAPQGVYGPAVINAEGEGHLQAFTQDERDDADFRAVVNPQNQLILPAQCTRGEALKFLSSGIPTNEFGLPIYYLRSDMLALDHICALGHTTRDEVDMAAEVLTYSDGYPAFGSGSPFWVKMPHEPLPSYILFQRFLELAEEEGIRLIDSLARMQAVSIEQVKEAYNEFYWAARARAYDLFIVAAEAKRKEAQTRKAERKHYDVAGKLLEDIVARFEDPELIEKMDAKELLDAFETMVKIQRLSLGLTGQNASTINKDVGPASSVEVIMRNLTKNSGLSEASGDSIQTRLGIMMGDQDTAMMMQELIVRATTGNTVNSQST